MKEMDDDYDSDEGQSTNTETVTSDSTQIDDDKEDENDNNRMATRQSPRKKVRLSPNNTNGSSPRRRSSRKIADQTKSRITSMCKFPIL